MAGCSSGSGGGGGGETSTYDGPTQTIVEKPTTTISASADAEADSVTVTSDDGDDLPIRRLAVSVKDLDTNERATWDDDEAAGTLAVGNSLTFHLADGTVTLEGEEVSSALDAPFTDVTEGTQYLVQVIHSPTNTVIGRKYVRP